MATNMIYDALPEGWKFVDHQTAAKVKGWRVATNGEPLFLDGRFNPKHERAWVRYDGED